MKNKISFLAQDNKVEILSKKINENGYLIIECIFARIGIQERYGVEISPAFEPSKLYKEYRSAKEVFASSVLEGFRNVTITNDHPQEQLNSINTKYFAVGFVSSDITIHENKFLKCTITIFDQNTIDDIQAGKIELSAGYLYSIIMAEGKEYDYEQIDIKPNHIAIVEAGRCGSACSIAFDTKLTKRINMKKIVFKVMLPNGEEKILMEIEVPEDLAVQVQELADAVFANSKELCDALSAKDEDIVESENQIKEKDEEIVSKDSMISTLQAQVDSSKQTPAKDCKIVAGLAKDMASVAFFASDVLGSKVEDILAKDSLTVKKEVIAKVNPNMDLTGKDSNYVDSAYDVIKAQFASADKSYLLAMNMTAEANDTEADKEQIKAKDNFAKKFLGGNK